MTSTTSSRAPGSPTTSTGTAGMSIRGGWGVYQDFGYTNSNVLFPAIDASGLGHGPVFSVNNTTGIRKADGTLFRVGDPISTIAEPERGRPEPDTALRAGRLANAGAAIHAAGQHRLGAPVDRPRPR